MVGFAGTPADRDFPRSSSSRRSRLRREGWRNGLWLMSATLLLIPGCAERLVAVVGEPEPDSEFIAVAEPVAPFTLTDQMGQEFSSEELAGKVWLGAVFFANCPGPCFRENQAIADLLRRIADPDLLVVSLTCDPVNDTPEALATYAARFDADPTRWKFLTGDLGVIEQVGQRVFRLPVELGVHSERGVVFDRLGGLRGGYHLLDADKVGQLERLIRDVLSEKPPAAESEIVP